MKKEYLLNTIMLLFICLVSQGVKSQQYDTKVKFIYLKSEKFAGSSRQTLLYFKIINNTPDTLFLSVRNIKLIIKKDGKVIGEEKNRPAGLVVSKITSQNKSLIDRERKHRDDTELIRKKFGQKLYFKNFKKNKSKQDQDYIINMIKDDCIVLFPHQTVNYSKLFLSKEFSTNCMVTAKYLNTNKFTYYLGVDDKMIYILK